MNEAMMIQGTALQIKEYKGKRVVTFKDIDTVHQRPIGTAHRNFKANRQRFISGVDFFQVKPSDFQRDEFRPTEINNNGTTLITETGYMMLVKSFTDDLAWKVQRELVDTYFKIRAEPETIQQTVTVTEPIETQNPEIYLEASKIMSGCLEGNRPYVLNILRHVIPDIDVLEVKQKVTEVKTEVARLPDTKKSKQTFWKQGVEIDVDKLKMVMNMQHISPQRLACDANVTVNTVQGWIDGKHKPVLQNRINLCMALGEDENFLTPKRTRRRK